MRGHVRRVLQTRLAPRAPALALAAVLLFAAAADTASARQPTVILLSWDGVRHDYPERAELPGLARMQRAGARAERLVPTFPSNTFPAHVSLATGAPPGVHGIVDNRFLDPERGRFDYDGDAGWIEAEPIWVAAERQGVRSAVFFWVGSETDWRGVGATHRVTPFASSVPEHEKVDHILAWLDLPEPERPRLVLSWWHGADHAGHRHGPDAAEVAEALRGQDAQLVRLLEGLDARGAWPHTTLLLVSDHGMTAVERSLDLAGRVRELGFAARVVGGGAVAHVWLETPGEAAALAAALDATHGVSAWTRDAVPEALGPVHPVRTGHVLGLAEPPLRFGGRARGGALRRLLSRVFPASGGHGYAPSHPDMGGVFLALGRGVPEGAALGAVDCLQVAPTVARLLGIEPPARARAAPVAALGAPAQTTASR